MRMDSRIILAGQQPDFANALAGGVQAGQAVRQAQTQNALAELFKTQGAGIMSGDQNALNALAQISPDAALGIMGQRQQMDARAQDMQFGARRMEILNAEEARRVEEYAATKTAAERAEEAAQIEDAVKQGMIIQTPEQWDQVMATEAPDLVGQFGNRDALAGKYMTMAEILKQQRPDPAAVTQGAPTGYVWTDPNDRTKGVAPIAGYQNTPKPQSTLGKLKADFDAGLISQRDYLEGVQKANKPSGIQVNVGGENSSAFVKKGDEAAATRLGEVVAAGQQTQTLMGDIQALVDLSTQIGTGKDAQVVAALGPYAEMLGIKVDGLGEIQAFEGIAARLAPALRTPGSGGASDFDAKQFVMSLPSLGKTPEGNRIIADTLATVAQHKQAAAAIANKAFSGEITWQQADQQIAALGNPFEKFNASRGRIGGDRNAPRQTAPVQIDGFTIEGLD